MSMRDLTLNVFGSVKGGVGKTTLAITCARLLAAKGRVSVVIDADLTGTSIADGLSLCAPDVVLDGGGVIDWEAPVAARMDRKRTQERRNARRDLGVNGRGRWLPFLNDLLLLESRPEQELFHRFLWEHSPSDSVWYLPSSPLRDDVSEALGWLYNEAPHAWIQRFARVLDGICAQDPRITDIVVDLPPGVFGFAHEVLSLVSYLEEGISLPPGFPNWSQRNVRWKVSPFLVASEDRNDLLPAVEFLERYAARFNSMRLIINRQIEAPSELSMLVRNHVKAAGPLGLEKRLAFIPERPQSLGRLFRGVDVAPLVAADSMALGRVFFPEVRA